MSSLVEQTDHRLPIFHSCSVLKPSCFLILRLTTVVLLWAPFSTLIHVGKTKTNPVKSYESNELSSSTTKSKAVDDSFSLFFLFLSIRGKECVPNQCVSAVMTQAPEHRHLFCFPHLCHHLQNKGENRENECPDDRWLLSKLTFLKVI